MRTRTSKIPAVAVMLALTVTLTAAQPRPAHAITPAAITPAVAIQALEKAFTAFQSFRSFFSEPSTAELIQRAVDDLIRYMNAQRDLHWISAAHTAAADLAVLSRRQPNDPTNDELFQAIWYNLTDSTIDQMYTFLRPGTDPTSSYQIASVLNELAAAWIGLNIMKGQIFPGFPSTWGDYQGRLQKVIDLDYFMVGARIAMCYPGFNPGRGNYNISSAVNGYHLNRHFFGQLFRMLGNKWVAAGPRRYEGAWAWTPHCNLKTDKCQKICEDFSCKVVKALPTTPYLNTARFNFDPTFSADPVVQIVRAGMRGLMSVGGGNDPGDSPSTAIPAQGMFLDPWVWESAVCAPFWSSAYASP
jgi:hypothetical protein